MICCSPLAPTFEIKFAFAANAAQLESSQFLETKSKARIDWDEHQFATTTTTSNTETNKSHIESKLVPLTWKEQRHNNSWLEGSQSSQWSIKQSIISSSSAAELTYTRDFLSWRPESEEEKQEEEVQAGEEVCLPPLGTLLCLSVCPCEIQTKTKTKTASQTYSDDSHSQTTTKTKSQTDRQTDISWRHSICSWLCKRDDNCIAMRQCNSTFVCLFVCLSRAEFAYFCIQLMPLLLLLMMISANMMISFSLTKVATGNALWRFQKRNKVCLKFVLSSKNFYQLHFEAPSNVLKLEEKIKS